MAASFPSAEYAGQAKATYSDGSTDAQFLLEADCDGWDDEIIAVVQALRAGVLLAFYNDTGGTLNAGDLVYIDGYDLGAGSGLPIVAKAQADSDTTPAEYVVIAAVATTENGNLARRYKVTGLDTSGKSGGDAVYLDDATAANWTTTAPADPGDFVQRVGTILRVDASLGEIGFDVDTGESNAAHISVSAGADASNKVPVTIQVKGYKGANVLGRRKVSLWVSGSSFGAVEAQTSLAINGSFGIEIAEITANGYAHYHTDANGKLVVDVERGAGAATKYIHVTLEGSRPIHVVTGTWT